MLTDAIRKIANGQTDPDPVSAGPIASDLIFTLKIKPPRSDVVNQRVALFFVGAAAETITVSLYAVIEASSPADPSPDGAIAGANFVLLETGVVLTANIMTVRDFPLSGWLYARVTATSALAGTRPLYASGAPGSSSIGASGAPPSNVNATIVAPLGVQTPAASVAVVQPGLRGQAGAASLASFVDNQNVLALRQYRLTPPVLTDTQVLLPQVDVSGNDRVAEQFMARAEDNTNNLFAVAQRPLTGPTYARSYEFAPTVVSNLVVKASAGVFYGMLGYIDPAVATGLYYLMVLNEISAVNGVRNLAMHPIRMDHVTGTKTPFDFGDMLAYCLTGITICLSSTGGVAASKTGTVTLVASSIILTAEYGG